MKLCITASGKDMDALVDSRFGRAPFFLLIDTETLALKAVANSASTTGQGAGIRAAQALTDWEVDALLTGRVGPNAVAALQDAGIKVYEGVDPGDTVQTVMGKFNQGKYTVSSGANSRGGCSRSSGPGRGGGHGRGWEKCRP